MSTKLPRSKDYIYQKNSSSYHNSVPIKTHGTKKTELFTNRGSSKNTVSSFVDENQEFYRFSYIFQDKPDNTNNVIFDSISRKYRTRSNSKPKNTQSLFQTFNKKSQMKDMKSDENHNKTSNTIQMGRLNNFGFNKNSEKVKSHPVAYSNNNESNNLNNNKNKMGQINNNINQEKKDIRTLNQKTYQKRNEINSQTKTKIDKEKEKNKNEKLIGQNTNQIGNKNISHTREEAVNQIRTTIDKLREKYHNRNTTEPKKIRMENNNISQSRKEMINHIENQNASPGRKEAIKYIRTTIDRLREKNKNGKLNEQNKNPKENNYTSSSRKETINQAKITINKPLEKNKLNKNDESSKIQTRISTSNGNNKNNLENIQKDRTNYQINKNIQSSQTFQEKNQNNINIISPMKTNKQQEKIILGPEKENLMNNIDDINLINVNKNKRENLSSTKKIQNTDKRKETEEKIIVLIPGQTIEKKTIEEKFEEPIEEIVQNPDGTYNLFLKQTKITTITENIPVESQKIKLNEGASELPVYKQLITYNYETMTTLKPKKDIKGNNIISRNLNQEEDFVGNIIDDQNNNNDYNIHITNIDPKILPRGFQNEKELQKFLEGINKKAGKITPEEKEKLMNCFQDMFNNISKGENVDENLEKLSQILSHMNGKERNEILKKLSEDKKNINLLKKLESLVNENVERFYKESKKYRTGFKNADGVEVREVNPLKFEGLFMNISQYGYNIREKNPFEGPSPYNKFYKDRSMTIKKKIKNIDSNDIDQIPFKLED